MYCPHCGAENPDSAQYCNLCLTTTGFQSLEYPNVAGSDEGYLPRYPSSFKEGPGDAWRGTGVPGGTPTKYGNALDGKKSA